MIEILLVLLILGIIAAWWFNQRPEALSYGSIDYIAQLYNNQKSNGGGLLIHMMSMHKTQTLLSQTPFVLNANDRIITGCSAPVNWDSTGPTAQTCSSWTLLRNDLMPCIYQLPGISNDSYTAPSIGILVDTELIWGNIASMSVIDSDTVTRNCCQNPWSDLNIPIDCSGGAVGTIPAPVGITGQCSTDCAPGDDLCYGLNAGGAVNVRAAGCYGENCNDTTKWSNNLSNWNCQGCNLQSCNICSKLQICDARAGVKQGTLWSEQVVDGKYARNLIGENGEDLQKLMGDEQGLRNIWDISVLQCKFQRQDWNMWIKSLKEYYMLWLANFDGKQLRTQTNPGSNSFLAVESVAAPIENEVNLYFNPPTSANIAQLDIQNKTFRDAIVGIVYVVNDCITNLAELDGVVSTDSGKTYNSALDRCQAYICPDGGCDAKLAIEKRDIAIAKSVATDLAHAFNTAYRSPGSYIKTFAYIGGNQLFFPHSKLKMLESGTIPISMVLEER